MGVVEVYPVAATGRVHGEVERDRLVQLVGAGALFRIEQRNFPGAVSFGVTQSENSTILTSSPCSLARAAANWMMSAIGPLDVPTLSGSAAIEGDTAP